MPCTVELQPVDRKVVWLGCVDRVLELEIGLTGRLLSGKACGAQVTGRLLLGAGPTFRLTSSRISFGRWHAARVPPGPLSRHYGPLHAFLNIFALVGDWPVCLASGAEVSKSAFQNRTEPAPLEP